MPYKNKEDRKYTAIAQAYDGSPEIKERRAARNRARYQLEKEGLVSKGDGKQVDHIKPLSKGGSTKRENLRAVSTHANESFDRTSTHAVAAKKPRKTKKI
jgi:5-methylcytosine-specific restriction endonuclease McrA